MRIRINRPLQRATHAYLLRLGERRKNTKLMQFCNYTVLARPFYRPFYRPLYRRGVRRNARDMRRPFLSLGLFLANNARIFKFRFVSASLFFHPCRRGAPPVINWRIQSPSAECTYAFRFVANLADTRRILLTRR